VADVGYTITTRARFNPSQVLLGSHGYDNMSEDMQAIFVANGYVTSLVVLFFLKEIAAFHFLRLLPDSFPFLFIFTRCIFSNFY
jgi:hypothetical protein